MVKTCHYTSSTAGCNIDLQRNTFKVVEEYSVLEVATWRDSAKTEMKESRKSGKLTFWIKGKRRKSIRNLN